MIPRGHEEIEAGEENRHLRQDGRGQHGHARDRAAILDLHGHGGIRAEDRGELLLELTQRFQRLLEIGNLRLQFLPNERRPRHPLAERNRKQRGKTRNHAQQQQHDHTCREGRRNADRFQPVGDGAEHQPHHDGQRHRREENLPRLQHGQQHRKADPHHGEPRRIVQHTFELALAGIVLGRPEMEVTHWGFRV